MRILQCRQGHAGSVQVGMTTSENHLAWTRAVYSPLGTRASGFMPDHLCAWVCQSHAHNSHSCYFFVCAFTRKQSKYFPQAVCISWITLSWSLLGTEWRTCNLQWVSQTWCWSKEPRHDAACSVSFCRWEAQKEAKMPILHEIGTPCFQGGSVEEAKGNTWGPTPFWLPQIGGGGTVEFRQGECFSLHGDSVHRKKKGDVPKGNHSF